MARVAHLIQLPRAIIAALSLKVFERLYSKAETLTKFIKTNAIKNTSTHVLTRTSPTPYTFATVPDTAAKFIIAKDVDVRERA